MDEALFPRHPQPPLENETMAIVRRLYLYTAFLIGLAASVNGLIQTLNALWQPGLARSANVLAGGLASLLVGFPVMLGHGLWAQRLGREHLEERQSWIRAAALHLAWAIPWLFALYRLLRFVRQAVEPYFLAKPFVSRADWHEGIWIVVVNALVGAFFAFWNWKETGPAQRVFRRIQGWFWTLNALALASQGLFRISQAWLTPMKDPWPQGIVWTLAGVLVGLAVAPWWRKWEREEEERRSAVHATLTLLTGLTGLAVVVVGWVQALQAFSEAALGVLTWAEAGPRLGVLLLGRVLPWGVATWWMGHVWRRIEPAWPTPKGRLLRARAEAIAALGGLLLFGGGLIWLWRALAQAWLEGLGASVLAQGIAFAGVGLPLWWGCWQRLQRDAFRPTELGHAVRRSLSRRGVLYAVLLGSVLTLMAALGALVYHGLLLLLAGETWPLVEWWTAFGSGAVAAALGALHWAWLRQDQAWEATQQAQRLAVFHVWLLSDGTSPALGLLQERLRALAPQLPLHWHDLSRGLPAPDQPMQAVVLVGHTLSTLNDMWRLWFERFTGAKLVLPWGGPWLWVGGDETALAPLLEETIQRLRTLALGGNAQARERWPWWQILLAALGLLFWAQFWLLFLGE